MGTGEIREPSRAPQVKVTGRGQHQRPEPSGAFISPSTSLGVNEARHESNSTQASLPTGDEVAAAAQLREEMRVERIAIARDAAVEELIADFGIALWLNKPARRKAAA